MPKETARPLPWEIAGASGAHFSACRTWRYALWRTWNPELRPTAFIGLNPSTADETENDPTVRRAINFAKKWGTGGLFMLNVYGLRSTDPKGLYGHDQPLGEEHPSWLNMNDFNVVRFARLCSIVVAAWGTHVNKLHKDRSAYFIDLLKQNGVVLHCLGKTKDGSPKHPLYLKNASELIPYP